MTARKAGRDNVLTDRDTAKQSRSGDQGSSKSPVTPKQVCSDEAGLREVEAGLREFEAGLREFKAGSQGWGRSSLDAGLGQIFLCTIHR